MSAIPSVEAGILRDVVVPTFQQLLPAYDSPRARVMLLAIGLQESRLIHRAQIGGPARGLWQFERGGGVRGVLRHRATKAAARGVCETRGVVPDEDAVYSRLASDDLLACAFARLLLFTDPAPLPAVDDEASAWAYYLRDWRPGKPHPGTWPALHARAAAVAGGNL